MRREVGMMLLLLFSMVVITPQSSAGLMVSEDPGVSDVVTWQVGDKWIYAGSFDPSVLITDAGVDASVGTIEGDTTTIVEAISTRSINGIETLVYEVKSNANFDKGGVQLDSYTGNLFIEYQVDEVRRVSDLAKLSSDLSLYVRYVPYGISSLTQEIADITISTTYDPMSEAYDFPLRIGETWNTSYVSSTAWSGSSNYITPFPQPTSGANHTNYEITDVGRPISSIGEQIGYSGCNASYEIKSSFITSSKFSILDALEKLNLSKSRSDTKRLIKSKGIRINEEIYSSSDLSLKIYANKPEIKISVGKKNIGILKIKK